MQNNTLTAAQAAPKSVTLKRSGAASLLKDGIPLTIKDSAPPPRSLEITAAVTPDTIQGTSAEYCAAATIVTSTAKTAAATGVPKRAEKPAAMPHMISMEVSSLSSLKSFPKGEARLPPIWRAAPSRPAEPPVMWVKKVAAKISGASFIETFS